MLGPVTQPPHLAKTPCGSLALLFSSVRFLSSVVLWTSSVRSRQDTASFKLEPQPRAVAFDRASYSKMSDIEKMIGGDYAQLTNTNIRSFGWKGVTVTVKDRQSQQSKTILSDVNGIVKAGELLALMGPS